VDDTVRHVDQGGRWCWVREMVTSGRSEGGRQMIRAIVMTGHVVGNNSGGTLRLTLARSNLFMYIFHIK
jgi:hypothetical protein